MEVLEDLKEKLVETTQEFADLVKERFGEYWSIRYGEKDEAEQALNEVLQRLELIPEKLKEEVSRELGEIAASFVIPALQAIIYVLHQGLFYIGFALGWADLLREAGRQRAAMEVPVALPSREEALRLWHRFPDLRDKLTEILKRQGVGDDIRELLVLSSTRFVDTANVIDAYVKQILTYDEAFEELQRQGYTPSDAEILLRSAFAQLSPDELIRAWFRGVIDDEGLRFKLQQRGLRDEDIYILKQVSLALPGIGDLIRMMVRDVFNEAVVKRYGYDEEYPAEIEKWLKMQGMDPSWGRAYWRAHWELPSPTMAIEMVRRGIIGVDDFDTLLKIADYPRFWRERMRELIFEVPTRVDVRRMYDLGVVDERYVYETYRKLGYRDEDAKALTEFTILDTISEERSKLRTQLLGAFEDGLITESELREGLRALRYNDSAIDVIVKAKKYELERDLLKAYEDAIKVEYMEGKIDESTAISRLAHLGVTTEAINRIVTRWRAEKLKKHRRLTLTQLKELWRKRLIDESRLLQELREMGYTKDDAELLVRLIKAGGQVE